MIYFSGAQLRVVFCVLVMKTKPEGQMQIRPCLPRLRVGLPTQGSWLAKGLLAVEPTILSTHFSFTLALNPATRSPTANPHSRSLGECQTEAGVMGQERAEVGGEMGSSSQPWPGTNPPQDLG